MNSAKTEIESKKSSFSNETWIVTLTYLEIQFLQNKTLLEIMNYPP